MKILVFSDSHNDVDTMYSITTNENPDMILHLGDHIADGLELQNHFRNITIHLVSGNTDRKDCYSEELFLNVSGKQLFITHGHLYNVKSGLTQIHQKGVSIEAHIVLFGHTHKPYLSYTDGMWLLNPGRIGRRPLKPSTYGVIRIEDEKIKCEIIEAK